MHKELRQAQAMLGQPAQDPAYCIVKAADAPHGWVYWTGTDWSMIQAEVKLYPSIKAALEDHSVPPAITEVIRHS